MQVVIRTDASIHIGSGHVMRCLVLAEAMKEIGYQVSFACRDQAGSLIDFISSRGINVIRLEPVTHERELLHDADYIGWLQRSVQEDVEDFLSKVECADLVITDHYAIGKEWQTAVKEKLGCKIVAIDDLGREHDADVLIDQTLGRQAKEYSNIERILAGSRYALLKPDFANLRMNAYARIAPEKDIRVLVSLGGIDKSNVTLRVIKLLSIQPNISLTVLLNSRAPNYSSVICYCSEYSSIVHFDFTEDMATLMLKHDIAVGASGSTSWERACLGLPSVVIPLADNQKLICERLVASKAAIAVDEDRLELELLPAINKLVYGWSVFHSSNLSICDGRGVDRVLQEIVQLNNTYPELTLVPAEEGDIALVFEWQSNPKTRKYALQPKAPCWDEHKSWMMKKLQGQGDFFYMAVDKKTKIKLGVLRLDLIKPEHYLVSLFIDPLQYGKGVALSALETAKTLHPNATFHATVLPGNKASQKLFEKARYVRVADDKFLREPI